MSRVKGGCHCGSVSWEFDLPIKTVVKCHCAMCRKLQGSDHSTYGIVPKERFLLTKGKEAIVCYQATKVSHKNFCSSCGSPTHLMNGKHFPDEVVLPLGLIENYTDVLAPQIQVYTLEKAPWSNIHEDVPIFS